MSQTEWDWETGESFSLEDILNEYRSESSRESAETYQIPAAKPAPHRSSLPTEDEVRRYLASYARGEAEPSFEPRRKAGPEAPSVDERFHLGGSRAERRMRYGGEAVDNSAEVNYRPRVSNDFIATNIKPEENADKSGDGEKTGLVQRIRDRMAEQRQNRAREEAKEREGRHRIRIPEPQELILPGEKPYEEPAARRPEPAPAPAPAPEPEPEAAAEKPLEVKAAPAKPSGPKTTKHAAPKPAKPEVEEDAEEEIADELPPKRRFTPSWSRDTATHREYASLFPDTSASPAIYSDEPEPGKRTKDGDARIPLKKDPFFPANFKEYLLSLSSSIFYGLRKGAETIVTAEEDDEDLGPEATPAAASRYYGRFIRSYRLRARLCAVVLLVMGWISLGLPVFGQLANIRVAAWFCLAMQLTVMLLCLDVLSGGVMNAFRRRFGADSMAVLACLATSLDALLVATGKLTQPHMPLCFLSSLSLTGVLLASLMSCRGLRKSLRVPAIAKRAYTVTGEMGEKERGTTILKSQRSYTGFVRRSEEAPPDETLFQKLCLPLLVLIVFLSLLTMIVTRDLKDMIYIFSALVCAGIPFGALLCFALPYFSGSFRIFPSGAAVAGWSGLCDVGQSKNLIVTDRDLFPDGTVDIDQVRIFADAKPETIISYAGSMLIASGSCVSKNFAEMMEKHHCAMRQIEDFEYLPGGGMKGVIDSRLILCGSSELMQLMNVRLPFRLISRTSILLAVDGILYGIFNMKYTGDPQVRRALVRLMRSTRHPIFAIRDFNVTPVMLRDTFDVPTDGYDFPPYVDRFAISSAKPGEDSKVAAVVCRDGLGPLSNMADVGHRMYVATRTGLYLTAIGAVLGVLLCFIRMIAAGGVSVLFLFLYMLLITVPLLIIGTTLNLE